MELVQLLVEQGYRQGHLVKPLVDRSECRRKLQFRDGDVHVVQPELDGPGVFQHVVRLIHPFEYQDLLLCIPFLVGPSQATIPHFLGEPLLNLEIVVGHVPGMLHTPFEPVELVNGPRVPGGPCSLKPVDSHDVLGVLGPELGINRGQEVHGVLNRVLPRGDRRCRKVCGFLDCVLPRRECRGRCGSRLFQGLRVFATARVPVRLNCRVLWSRRNDVVVGPAHRVRLILGPLGRLDQPRRLVVASEGGHYGNPYGQQHSRCHRNECNLQIRLLLSPEGRVGTLASLWNYPFLPLVAGWVSSLW